MPPVINPIGTFKPSGRENMPFTKTQQQALVENSIQFLYIQPDQRDLYWEYLRSNIDKIITSDVPA